MVLCTTAVLHLADSVNTKEEKAFLHYSGCSFTQNEAVVVYLDYLSLCIFFHTVAIVVKLREYC